MKKILYLFDDINYQSGVQKVTFFQMKTLSSRYEVHAFSLSKPLQHPELQHIPVIGEEVWEKSELFSYSLKKVFSLKDVSCLKKMQRLFYSVLRKVGKGDCYLERLICQKMKRKFEEYDVVIVVSEASKLRKIIAQLEHPKKIQWIHTDYARWSEFSGWTRRITREDAKIYTKFDRIVTLSEYSRKGFIKKLPHIQEKTITIPNLIDGETILRKAEETIHFKWREDKTHIVTVGRLDREKACDRVLDICKRLKKEGYTFCWYLIGDGSLKGHLERRIQSEQLAKEVKLLGRLENPYPFMKRCDWFVLLSEYEGTPVTIDEAMVLGVPVMAADVGGIAEQIERYGRGIVLKPKNQYKELKKKIIKKEQRKPIEYKNFNKEIVRHLERLLEEERCGGV